VEVIRGMPGKLPRAHRGHRRKPRASASDPSKGAIDFPHYTPLGDVKYAGRVTVELYPYETTAAGVAKAAWGIAADVIKLLHSASV
jgi:hypothetical protein